MALIHIDLYPPKNHNTESTGVLPYQNQRSLKSCLQEKVYALLLAIDGDIEMFRNGLRIADPICKINTLVREFKALYCTEAGRLQKSLSHLQFTAVSKQLHRYGIELKDVNLIPGLIERALSKNPEQKFLAIFTMQRLEMIDPTFSSISYQAALSSSQSCAGKRLQRFARVPQLQFKRPMTFFKPVQTNPMVSKVQRQFWRAEKFYIGGHSYWHYQNMKQIGKNEHFKVRISSVMNAWNMAWLRDIAISKPSGGILIPCAHPIDDSLLKTLLYFLNEMEQSTMGWVGLKQLPKVILESKLQKLTEAPFYFEGGNVQRVLNTRDQKVVCCGAHNLPFSLMLSHHLYRSNEEGLLTHMKRLEQEKYFTTTLLKSAIAALMRSDLISTSANFPFQAAAGKLALTILSDIKAKMEIFFEDKLLILGGMFEPMPSFHLDMFMAFAPGGLVLLHDDALAMRTIEEILKGFLTHVEIKQLLKYYRQAALRAASYGKQTQLIREQLESAHFTVVPVAGMYFSDPDTMKMNLVNAVFGVNPEGQAYCISNGSCHPADRILRGAFVKQLADAGIQRVYFTGRKTKGCISQIGDFSFKAANLALMCGGGIHCLTQTADENNKILFESDPLPQDQEKIFPQAQAIQLRLFFERMVKKIFLNKPD